MDWHSLFATLPLLGVTGFWRGVRIGGKVLGDVGGTKKNKDLTKAFDAAKKDGNRQAMESIARRMNEQRLKDARQKAVEKNLKQAKQKTSDSTRSATNSMLSTPPSRDVQAFIPNADGTLRVLNMGETKLDSKYRKGNLTKASENEQFKAAATAATASVPAGMVAYIRVPNGSYYRVDGSFGMAKFVKPDQVERDGFTRV